MVFPELLATDGQAAGEGWGLVWYFFWACVGVVGQTREL